jgi:hypothetical protein
MATRRIEKPNEQSAPHALLGRVPTMSSGFFLLRAARAALDNYASKPVLIKSNIASHNASPPTPNLQCQRSLRRYIQEKVCAQRRCRSLGWRRAPNDPNGQVKITRWASVPKHD